MADEPGHKPERRGWPQRLCRATLKLTVLLLSVALSLLAAEGIVRLVAPQPPTWLDIYCRHPSLATYSLQSNAERHLDTGESRWDVYTDANGFRYSGRPSGLENKPVAMVLGDSFAFGLGLPHEQTFVGMLEAGWGGQYRVVNAGVSGYGPRQYREVLEYWLGKGLSPRIVIVATYLGNDFQDLLVDKNEQVVHGVLVHEWSYRQWIKRHSHLYRLVARGFRSVSGQESQQGQLNFNEREVCTEAAWKTERLEKARDLYRQEMGRIQTICRDRGIVLVACIIPAKECLLRIADDSRQHPEERNLYRLRLPAEQAARVFQELGVPFCDTTDDLAVLGPVKGFFRFDGHLTEDGSRVVARCIRRMTGSALPTSRAVTSPSTLEH